MNTLLVALVIVGLIATAAVLATGIGSMAHGGRFDEAHSHHLMFARVGVQALTVALLALLVVITLV